MKTISNLSVPLESSIFHNQTFYESVDISSLEQVINNMAMPPSEKRKLQKYKELIDNNKQVPTKYKHGKTPMGRVFVEKNLGLQNFKQEIRNQITNNLYITIDIKNAFPTILAQLCQYHNIDAPFITYYANNQDRVLRTIRFDKNKTKQLFLRMIHCGSIYKWRQDFNATRVSIGQFPYHFERECIIVGNTIKDANIFHNSSKGRGSTIAKVLQYHENKILESMYRYLHEKQMIKCNDCVLLFDGIMIRKNQNINNENIKQQFGKTNIKTHWFATINRYPIKQV